jgi:hypothetical protein
MTARCEDDATSTGPGAVVRKPPGKEPAGNLAGAVPRAMAIWLWRGGLTETSEAR